MVAGTVEVLAVVVARLVDEEYVDVLAIVVELLEMVELVDVGSCGIVEVDSVVDVVSSVVLDDTVVVDVVLVVVAVVWLAAINRLLSKTRGNMLFGGGVLTRIHCIVSLYGSQSSPRQTRLLEIANTSLFVNPGYCAVLFV